MSDKNLMTTMAVIGFACIIVIAVIALMGA